jgi:hypothetical protein
MSYRTILVNLNIDGPVAPLMDYAINLAARFNSHLIGFAAAVPSAPMAWPEGMMTDGEMAREREEIELRMKNLRREFESHAGTNVSHEWRDGVANPTRLIIEMSRVADLIVTGCEDDFTLGHPERFINLGNLVLQAGRPVLVAAKGAKRIFTNTALIAWKDTREARRAVVDALPLLCQASEVVVVTVDRGGGHSHTGKHRRRLRFPSPPWRNGTKRNYQGQARERKPPSFRQANGRGTRHLRRVRP